MSTNPDYTFLPNYGGRSMTPAPRQYHPWSTALVATLIGFGVAFLIGMVLGFLGFAFAVGGGFRNATDAGIMAAAVVTSLAVQLVALVVQARYIGRRGGVRPVIACLAALVASFVIGLVSPFGGIETWAFTLAVQVAVIAVLTTPNTQR